MDSRESNGVNNTRRDKYSAEGNILNHLLNRGKILREVNNGARRLDQIVESTAKSKSSIQRDKRLLIKDNMILKNNNEYKTTDLGKHVLKMYDLVCKIGDEPELFEYIPSDVPLSLIQAARLTKSGGVNAQEPQIEIDNIIKQSREVQAIFPAVLYNLFDLFEKRVIQGELDAELILTDAVINEWRNQKGGELVLEDQIISREDYLVGADNLGMILTDSEVICLLIFDERHRLLATMKTRRRQEYMWGELMYERVS